MQDVLNVARQEEIPELNVYQCGTAQMHSLEEAKQIASNILSRDIGVNRNDELKLDEGFLNQAH